MPATTLTVVVCAYTMDRWDDLSAAIASLRGQTRPPDEVVLVIDHCPPLAERAAAHLPGARVVPSRGRRGLSGARNTGIAEAHGEIVAFLDDDAVADPRWAENLLAGYRDPRVLGVGGVIRPRWDRERPAWFPAEFDWVVGCTYRGMPQGSAPVRNLLGANMSFRRDVLTDCGGFSTDLGRVGTRPLGCEETELCIRAARRHPDGVLLHETAAAVRHHVPDQRATWSYFRARCYAEGLSKAAMTRRVPAPSALSTERAYLTSTIPHALLDALPRPRRGDRRRPSPATIAALLAGVTVTAAGYTAGRVRGLARRAPSPARDDQPAPTATPASPPDLHAEVPELLGRLREAARGGDLLDAYLAACGIDQVTEDRLRASTSLARRATAHLDAQGRGTPGRAALRCLDAADAVGARGPARRELHAWNQHVKHLISVLADAVLAVPDSGRGPRDRVDAALAAVGEQLPVRAARLLTGAVVRPPACFRSFDQHPRDVEELIARFTARRPDRMRPLLVLGVRTSGTYLAPLAASAARARGFHDVTVRGIRPGERLLPGETRTLRRIQRARGFVLLLDDPPSSGRSLAQVARAAEHAGFARDRVIPVFAAFGDHDGAPRRLADREHAVILPGTAWDIRRRLGPDALERTVRALLPADTPILAITSTQPGVPTRRGHLAVDLAVTVADPRQGPTDLRLVAEGAGLGYLGRHALTVADALTGTVPHVYGFADGVLLRDRGPQDRPAPTAPPDVVARYIATRRRTLPLPDDRSLQLAGREPVWEIAARLLAGNLARLGTPLRPLLIDPILRATLRAEHPCVIDGRMLPWLWNHDGDGWRKTGFDDGAFSHLDLASTDAVCDLAGAAVFAPAAEDELVTRYQQATGDRITPARWCAHKLVHAWNIQRLKDTGYATELAALDPARIQGRAVQQFLGALFLADLENKPDGPWCVLDLDGVLEVDVLGFPTATPAGALALRALHAHGYRVLLATGRPLPDVQDRCAAYRLPGAVAEYGAVIHDAASEETTALLPTHDGALAAELAAAPSTGIDPRYRCCVRAFRNNGHGRTGLDPSTVREILTRHPGYTPVTGDAQTDFVPTGLDKTRGIRALTRLLDAPDVPIALAVGDSRTDIAMLRTARLGLAPGNAHRRAMRQAGVPRLTGRYQKGLAQAVTRLIGHRPGACPTCRAPRPEPAEAALLALLAVPEGGRPGTAAGLLDLARARRTARPGGWSR